ncbi:hypothetical protein F5Y19DRAFT_461527 [Xylariaceae sp. FL1651]|nr:hypothetical protein F5Y19DRAFT_461527 [Xylariaceae sp. FL1651]
MALRAVSRRLFPAHDPFRRCTRSWPVPARCFSAEAASHPSNLVQVYISRSTDPYLNLSIEHFLLQKSHPDSVILLLYTNRPCIVIGRNQNPWVEVNLGLINQPGVLGRLRAEASSQTGQTGIAVSQSSQDLDTGENEGADDVLLVRRRSGGGTVFHDAGNVNYSVICPPASFDRNKHAEMVVRALRGLDATLHVRVNERHDIVLDVVPSSSSSSHSRNSSSGPESEGEDTDTNAQTYKISGSAYKLTRTRSLHHGTCLLSSPHLPLLSRLLRSPAAPYIRARGVESVRSPVRNVGLANAAFEDAVVAQFLAMYGSGGENVRGNGKTGAEAAAGEGGGGGGVEVEIVRAVDVQDVPEVRAGVAELRSRDWIYAQTPQFAFSSHPTADDPRPRPDLPADLPSPGLQMTVRHAQITEVAFTGSDDVDGGDSSRGGLVESLKGLHLHHVDDWRTHVGPRNESVGRWMNGLFGAGVEKKG